jgi:hypothetical protein
MLTTKEQVKDLGNLKFGKAHTFTYEIKNDTDQLIQVDKVIVGCGSCTTADLHNKFIKPGASSILKATFTPGSTGKQLKTIQLKQKDGPVLKLEFTADVHE